MRSITLYVAVAMFLALLSLCKTDGAQQHQDEHSSSQPPLNSGTVSLTVFLKLEDNSPFTDQATVHLVTSLGFEVGGTTKGPQGEIVFPGVWPGRYLIEAGARGFLVLKQNLEVKPDQSQQSLTLIMKPEPSNDAASSAHALPGPTANSWLPPGVDDFVPEVSSGEPCSLSKVLQGAGEHMEQFVDDLNKFSATARVEHYAVNAKGQRRAPDIRSFEYLVTVSKDEHGVFQLEESWNGSGSIEQFAAGIATVGVPGLALILHPQMVSDFNYACEGLGMREGRPAWQLRFEQRSDRPNRTCSLVIAGVQYPIPLKGRVWIDADTYQVLRLESELTRPITQIRLTQDRLLIEYASVRFQTQDEQLWLPKLADFYLEMRGERFYRHCTFSKFKVFSVGVQQRVHAPKESYCFTNLSNRKVSGTLTVAPASGVTALSVSLSFTIPAGKQVCKTVGQGKEVNISPGVLGKATFVHDGPLDSVKVDAHLINESTLEVISNTFVPAAP